MRRSKITRTITIEDVARHAGVGVGTVSRVLNDHPSVSPATRERVKDSIKALGYHPNAQARRLARGSTDTIAFVLSNAGIMHPFHARILHGVELHCSTTQLQVVYTTFTYPHNVPPSDLRLPTIISTRGVADGMIVAGYNSPNFLTRLQQIGLPSVVYGNNILGTEGIPAFDAVYYDDLTGAANATSYLISLGHKRIVFVGDVSYPWYKRRFDGYSRAMREAGLTPRKADLLVEKTSVDEASRIIRDLVDSPDRPTAILAGGDIMAHMLWRGMVENRIRIPEEMSLMGFENRDESTLTDPPLTTVHVPKEELGIECARLLIEKIKSPGLKLPSVVMSTELVIRQSTAPPAH